MLRRPWGQLTNMTSRLKNALPIRLGGIVQKDKVGSILRFLPFGGTTLALASGLYAASIKLGTRQYKGLLEFRAETKLGPRYFLKILGSCGNLKERELDLKIVSLIRPAREFSTAADLMRVSRQDSDQALQELV